MRIFYTFLTLALTAQLALAQQAFNAVAFTGAATYAQTNYNPNFGLTGDFSVEFRVKTNGWTGDPSLVSDKDWDSGLFAGFNIALGQGNNGIDVNVADGTNRADLEAGNVDDGQWHHVLVTFDRNGSVSLYVDGLLAQATPMGNVGNINSPFLLNFGQDGTGTYGPGTTAEMAEIKLWNKVLPLNEAVRCGGIDNTHPSWNDLIGYWPCAEGSGNTAADVKGTENATLVGGAGWTTGNTFASGCGTRAIGSGTALDLDGQNDWVDCSNNGGIKTSAASLNLPTAAITLECWAKPRRYRTWDGLVAFIQDNGNFERGWDLETRDNNKFGFALQSVNAGGLTYLESNNAFNLDEWYHIAGVYDGTTMRLYVNGVLENTSTDESGDIFYADSWLALGMYRDDNEQNAYDGRLDEVRIWNTARSEADIRATMCHRLVGNEAGLTKYWRCDDGAGTAVFAEGNSPNTGAFTNMNAANAWVNSGAPIGDTSVYLYPATWAGANLALGTNDRGNLAIDNLSGTANGVHIYRIDSLPASTLGINDLGDNNMYFGTFATTNAGLSYRFAFDYANYPLAVANENSLLVYNRPSGESPGWTVSNAALDAPQDQLVQNTATGRRELILAEFSGIACPPPSGLDTANVGLYAADILWNGNGLTYNIQYGLGGFPFGTGTTINGLNGNSYTLTNLAGSSTYDVYVQAVCGGANSGWAGPLTFSTTDPCPTPANVQVIDVTANSITLGWNSPNTNFIIEWGPAAFFTTPGIGIQTNANSNPFTLNGLQPNTAYNLFVKADCDSTNSNYAGPISFTTDVNIGLNEAATATAALTVFPNPAHDQVQVQWQQFEAADFGLVLRNALGQTVRTESGQLPAGLVSHEVSLQGLAAGLYTLEVTSGAQHLTTTLLVR